MRNSAISDSSEASIVVHGGAGKVRTGSIEERLAGCREAAIAGWDILTSQGSAMDAVTAAVVVLENNPLFNAGVGAPLNADGEIELDASIMDGASLKAGAVGAVMGVKNPIELARRVLEDGRHVLLVGEGARQFARQQGMRECAMEDLVTQRQVERWQAEHGTVGCVACDAQGRLAAATSTGGLFGKRPGRVGDSAIIGAGTFANHAAAVSCTGIGEAILLTTLARVVADYVGSGVCPAHAAKRAMALLKEKTGSEGGLIVVDQRGRIGTAHDAEHMPVCSISSTNHTPLTNT